MDYTHSQDAATDAGTGHKLHSDSAPVPTVWSAEDANSIIWSLMRVVEAAGVTPARFDPADQATYSKLLLAIQALGVPTGAVASFARNTAPSGWLECDGSAVNRTTYASLFAAIGTTFGAGDGSTTFGLPDLRGEFARGWDHGRGVDAGRAFGAAQTADEADHYHGTGVFTDGSNDDIELLTRDWSVGGLIPTRLVNGNANAKITGTTTGDTSASDKATGTTDALSVGTGETRPRNVALMFCIKT